MTLLIIAFLSGVLTVLAPCVLPLLPIVLGASAEDSKSKRIPLIIIASLSVSIIVFSLLLKASTVLIGVPPSFWKSFSGGLIIGLGIITIFPNLWKTVSGKFGFSGKSNELLHKSNEKKGVIKYIFMGAALGPVFSSCSPTYALILAIILPAGFVFGFLALIFYTLGLAVILFAIAVFGQKLIKNLKWVSDPNGMFKKILGVIFVLVGLAIISGYDKKIETAILDAGFLNTTNFEQSIIDELELDSMSSGVDTKDLDSSLRSEGQEVESIKKKSPNIQLALNTCKDGTCDKKVEGSLDFIDSQKIIDEQEGYKAPDLVGLENWINSDGYNSLNELKGQVVMIDFWTLGCINCINTHEETQKLYDEFKDEGFTVLGLHAPEFAYERNISEVQKAVENFGITFPVAQDNDFSTWKAYNNRYWPAFYIIDTNGYIRHTHFGEGGYEEKREVIRELLAENPHLNSSPEGQVKEGAKGLSGSGNKVEDEASKISNNAASISSKGEQMQRGGFEQKFLSDKLTTNTALSSIDINLILDGGPGKDGIPAINKPVFITQQQAKKTSPYLGEDDLGIVLVRGDEARFYGYDVLVWHEIVNDEIAGEKIAVTFCPLCGSAIVYDRGDVNGREVNFGVSGKLYNSNLLMYDNHDETLWSQSLGEAVTGNQLGSKLEVVKSERMNYSEFQNAFPEGKVLSNETGYLRRYGEIPYGNYEESDTLYFPVENDDDYRFSPKKLFYIANDGNQSIAFAWDDLREVGEGEITIGDTIYKATFDNGLADITRNGEVLPGYFEMWFSWISHNKGNKNIWSKTSP